MPNKIPKTKIDKREDKKALKKAMKKHIPRLSDLMNDFWYNEGWMALDDCQKLTRSIRALKNAQDAVNSDEKWVSDEAFAEFNKSTELVFDLVEEALSAPSEKSN